MVMVIVAAKSVSLRTYKSGCSYKNAKTPTALQVCVKRQIYLKWLFYKAELQTASAFARMPVDPHFPGNEIL